jgi:hypothetical protein
VQCCLVSNEMVEVLQFFSNYVDTQLSNACMAHDAGATLSECSKRRAMVYQVNPCSSGARACMRVLNLMPHQQKTFLGAKRTSNVLCCGFALVAHCLWALNTSSVITVGQGLSALYEGSEVNIARSCLISCFCPPSRPWLSCLDKLNPAPLHSPYQWYCAAAKRPKTHDSALSTLGPCCRS